MVQFHPMGRIGKETTGAVYAVGSPQYISNLPACTASTIGSGIVLDGDTYVNKGYGTPVGTIDVGSLYRPVFCDGASWTYH